MKDLFNGKVLKDAYWLIVGSIASLSIGVVFFSAALVSLAWSFDSFNFAVRIVMTVVGSVGVFAGMAYPAVTVALIRRWPRHRAVTRRLVKESFLCDNSQSAPKP